MNNTTYDDLMTVLHANADEASFEARVSFEKLDGTMRDMRCRLGADGVDQGTHARVWDLDKQGYRTIRRNGFVSAGW